MTTTTHVHSYVRYKNNRYKDPTLFKCDDPHCEHYTDKEMILGKASLCPICRQTEFILTRQNLRCSRPRCDNCSQTNAAREKRRIADMVRNLIESQAQPGEDIP